MPFYSYPNPINPVDVFHEKHTQHHRKNLNRTMYTAMFVSLLVYGILALTEVFMEDASCDRQYARAQQNVDYQLTPCDFDRQIWLVLHLIVIALLVLLVLMHHMIEY